MAYRLSRALCRSSKVRFYSAQVMKKAEAASEVTSARLNELTIVTSDSTAPLSRIAIISKAGSRYEDPSNLGITHVIRHTAYLTNEQNSSFTTFKYLEALGAHFNTITTRDYSIFSVSCTRNVMAEAFQLISPTVTRTAFDPFDWRDQDGCASKVAYDVAAYNEQPNAMLMEELHAAAFRGTLGNSLYCPKDFVGSHTPQQVLQFMSGYYRPNRMAVVSTGADHDEVTKLVQQMKFSKTGGPSNDKKANYIGGERRVPRPDLDLTYAAIATEGPSLASKDLLSAAVLQHIMGLSPGIKYSDGSAGLKLSSAVAKSTDSPFVVSGLNVNYSDSGLFGFTVAANPADMEKVLKTAVSEFASLTKAGLTDAEVARGKNQLKASIAMSMENGDGVLMNLAEQAIGSDRFTSLKDTMAMIDAIQTSDVSNVAKKLVNGKPSMSVVGNLTNVPYLDQLLK